MGLYSIVDHVLSFSYTPLQILGVLAIVGVAIAVVMYFSALWSVERVRNEGTLIQGDKLHFSGMAKADSDSMPLSVTIRRADRDPQYLTQSVIEVSEVRYSYEKTYLQIMSFSVGNRHYILDHVLSEKVENDKIINKITMVGEYSCSASLTEDIVDRPYEVTIEYIDTIQNTLPYLNRMYADELTNIYFETDFEFLSNETHPYSDHLQAEMTHLRDTMPGLIDPQTSIRSLLFIMFYKMLDPGFRSIGLRSIQNLTLLMSMHIEYLRMSHIDRLSERTDDSDTIAMIGSIVAIEDSIRRFVSKSVTSKERRADVFDILDRHTRYLRDPNAELDFECSDMSKTDATDATNTFDDLHKMYRYLDTDLKTVAITSRMYGEILTKLADPDSNLHNEEISRLYALLSPLYSLMVSDNVVMRTSSIDQDLYAQATMHYTAKIDRYFNSDSQESDEQHDPPSNLIDMLKSTTSTTLDFEDPPYEIGLHALISKVWKSYDLNRRAIGSANRDTYSLLKIE
jgi:hypothetical protein